MKYGKLTLGQIEVICNKLVAAYGGDESVLRLILANKVDISIKKKVPLTRLGEVVLPAGANISSSRKKYWVEMSDGFRENVLSVEQIDFVPETTVANYRLDGSANDSDVQAEMPEGYTFDICTSRAFIFGMIGHGYLSTTGINIFYVCGSSEVFVVGIHKDSVHDRWHIDASKPSDRIWYADTRVLSRS